MTPSDFKAWLEGFAEAVDEAPTPAQWARIKDTLAKVHAAPAPALYNLPAPSVVYNPNLYPFTTCISTTGGAQ